MKTEVIQRGVLEWPLAVRTSRKALVIKIGVPKLRWWRLLREILWWTTQVTESLFTAPTLVRRVGPNLPSVPVEKTKSLEEQVPRFF